jgi:hypothetical protein
MMKADRKADAFPRLHAVTGCHTQTKLADLLGIRQSSISDAKKRNAIPAEWLVKLLRLKGINPEWVLTGLGPQKLEPANGEPVMNVVYLTETRPPKECSAQDLVNELVRRALINL